MVGVDVFVLACHDRSTRNIAPAAGDGVGVGVAVGGVGVGGVAVGGVGIGVGGVGVCDGSRISLPSVK